MAYFLNLINYKDSRGELTVLENADDLIPFIIKRVFYIYNVDESTRGGHRHHKTIQAAICINGSCKIWNNDGENIQDYHLDTPNKCLILETKDWHKIYDFTPDAILLVFASTTFDSSDYIYEPYPEKT